MAKEQLRNSIDDLFDLLEGGNDDALRQALTETEDQIHDSDIPGRVEMILNAVERSNEMPRGYSAESNQ